MRALDEVHHRVPQCLLRLHDRAPPETEMDARRREREASGADGTIGDLVRLPDDPLVAALAYYLERNSNDANQPPGWLALTLWALELVDGKPGPDQVVAALEALGGKDYRRMLLENTRGAS